MKKLIFWSAIILGLSACHPENKQVVAYTITAANDTLQYHYDTVRVVSSVFPSQADKSMDSTYAHVKYPVFDDEKINQYVKNVVQPFNYNKAFESYRDIATDFINGYHASIKEFPDSFATWYLDVNIRVIQQQFNYVAIAVDYSDFTGGAHGSYQTNYINFNPKTLKAIKLDSLIAPDKQKELTKIAENIFRKDEKISLKEPLDQQYFFDQGKFSLPDNFYLSKDGLVFLYNIYEIKPYAAGTTELIIPFNELKNISKPNSIIRANTNL